MTGTASQGKGVRRETESEGSRRQNSDPTNRNQIQVRSEEKPADARRRRMLVRISVFIALLYPAKPSLATIWTSSWLSYKLARAF